MKLPILFVCEDNELAVFTLKSARQGYRSLARIVSQFRCDVVESDTTDAEKVFALASRAREAIFKNQTPCFMSLKYYRYLEHVGIAEDFDAGYRDRGEFKRWRKKDPVDLQRKKLLNLGIGEVRIRGLEAAINRQIDSSFRLAQKAPFPSRRELHEDLFYEK